MISARSLSADRFPSAIVVALLATVLAANVVVAQLIAQGRITLLVYLAVCVAFPLSFLLWRQAMYAVFVVLFVEGYFRNLLNIPDVLLVKDLMLAAIYLRVLADRANRRSGLIPASPINVPLLAFTGIVLVQTLNPNVASVGQAVVGIRTWLFYVPLYFVAHEMFREERELRRFMWFVVLSAVPIGALALRQYYAGPDAYTSLGEGFERALFVTRSAGGIVYRPNATFAWSTNFAIFLALATVLCVGLSLASKGRVRFILWSLLAGLVVTNIIENQRTLLLLLPPLLLLMVALRWSTGRMVTAALACVLGLVVVAQVASPGALERMTGLMQNQDNILGVRAHTYLYSFRQALESPVGFGTGATSIGARHVLGGIPLFVEFSLSKVLADLSIVGLAVYLWLFLALLTSSFGLYKRAARNGLGSLAGLAVAIFGFQLLVAYTGYDLAIAAVPFWFLSGAVGGIAQSAIDNTEESQEASAAADRGDSELGGSTNEDSRPAEFPA
jgi:hypothetical protein